MRLCTRCGEIRALEEFGSNRAMWDGLSVYCKGCNRARANEKNLAKRLHAEGLAEAVKDEAPKGLTV